MATSCRDNPIAHTGGSRLCATCSQPITAQFARALGSVFHPDCFRCHDCDSVVIGKFFPTDGPDGKQQVLCERDYFARLNLVCTKCDGALRGSYITAGGKKYHPEHFTCSICPTFFGPQDSYYEHGSDVFCHWHYSTRIAAKCAGCNLAILKEFVDCGDGMFHPKCYMLFKSWDIRLLQTGDPAPKQPTYEIEERRTTPESLRGAQAKAEARVHIIWANLNAFEESSALCVRGVLAAWRAGDSRSIFRMAEEFVLHIQELFTLINETRNEPIVLSKVEGASQPERARALCDETTRLFALVSCPCYSYGSFGDPESNMAREVVVGLGYELKNLIKITVTGVLKLDDDGDALERFLDGLRALTANGGSESRVANKHKAPKISALVEKQRSIGVGDASRMKECAYLLDAVLGRLSWLLERNFSRMPSDSLSTSLTEKVGQDTGVDMKEPLRYDIESLTPQSPRCRTFEPSLVGVLLILDDEDKLVLDVHKAMTPLTLVWVLAAGLVRADDIQTVYQRRLPFAVASSVKSAVTVQSYIDTLQPDGTWPTVDYKTGCDAQRANWPAGVGHWNGVLAMAAAYHGGTGSPDLQQYIKSPALRAKITSALGYWFAHDFSTIGNGACLDDGGRTGGPCPCSTPGLWNQNWYSNVILVPTAAGKACLMLRDELTPTEYGNCTLITARAYAPFYRMPQPGYVSGANIIDMASIGIAAGLLENNRAGNASRITDAYQRVHNEVVVHSEDRVDGIKPDGSFQQHIGIIYDGNYGKDYSNALLELELQAAETAFQANASSRAAFGSHIAGTQWTIFADNSSKILHWDYSVIGRMIAFALADNQATANLKMNLTQVKLLGDAWNQTQLQKFARDLSQTPTSANAGGLLGNRMFWNSGYMVHRTGTTVTTLKLLSNRTQTSECVNTQNPLGFHLSDGTLYQYTTGQEYHDMYATFDFNLIPGITTDYNHTRLACGSTSVQGVETYAGGVSAGDVGVAAMRYVNPLTRALKFRKAWFFFGDNVQHVLVHGISSTSPAPVMSVLEQRLHNGSVYVDGDVIKKSGNFCDVTSLWHNGTGYVFPTDQKTALAVVVQNKTGDWKTIGTSTQPNSTKDMFLAWIQHDPMYLAAPIEYTIFPATRSHSAFQDKAAGCTPETLANGGSGDVSAAIDSSGRVMGAAFWSVGGGMVYVPQMGVTVFVDRPLVMVLKLGNKGNLAGSVYVADPTHETGTAHVRILWAKDQHQRVGPWRRWNDKCDAGYGGEEKRCIWGSGWEGRREVVLEFGLPTGGMAGSGVVRTFSWSS